MQTRKIVVMVEIETDDFDYAKEKLWELDCKIGDWCEEKGFVKNYRIKKYEEKKKETKRRAL